MKKAQQGFTLVEIMIVVAIIGILAAIAIPNFVKNRNESQKKACISNMRQISTACENWLTAHNMVTTGFSWTATTDSGLIGPDNYIKTEPKCPASGTYSVSVSGDGASVTCSLGGSDKKGHDLPENATTTTGTSSSINAIVPCFNSPAA